MDQVILLITSSFHRWLFDMYIAVVLLAQHSTACHNSFPSAPCTMPFSPPMLFHDTSTLCATSCTYPSLCALHLHIPNP